MRLLCTIVFLVLFAGGLYAQKNAETTIPASRAGQVWFNGNRLGAGYFFTDRLLVGGSVNGILNDGDFTFGVNPFARYYLAAAGKKYRPFAQLGADIDFTSQWGNFFRAVDARLGVERSIGQNSLLTLSLMYERGFGIDYDAISLRGVINTTLGSPGGRAAASNRLRRGSLSIGTSLFEASNFDIAFTRSDVLSRGIGLTPRIGYFLTNRLQVVAEADLSFYRQEQDENANVTYDRLNILRLDADLHLRYFLTTNRRFNPYLNGGIGYEGRTYTSLTTTADFDRSNWYGEAGAGVMYFINREVSLDLSLNYRRELNRDPFSNLNARVGLNYWFGNSK